MGIVIRQSIKSTIVSIAGAFLGGLIMFASSRVFPQIEVGFTRALTDNASVLGYLSILGFNYTLMIYGQRYGEEAAIRPAFLRYSLVVPALWTIVICLMLWFFRDSIIDAYSGAENKEIISRYYFLFPILIFLNFVWVWLEGYMNSINRNALAAFMREILFRVGQVVLIVLFACNLIDFTVFIAVFAFSSLLPVIFLLIAARKHNGFRFHGGIKLNKEIRKDILNFSFYHMLSMVSTFLIFMMYSQLLPSLAQDGMKAIAVYQFAFYAAVLVRTPGRMMGTAVTPTLTHTYNDNNLQRLRSVYHSATVNMLAASAFIALLILVNIDNFQSFVDLVSKEGTDYSLVKPLTLILVLGTLTDIVFGPNYELIGVTRFYRFNFWISLLLVVIIFGLNVWLIRSIGVTGAAWALTAGLIIFNALKGILLWQKFGITPFSKQTLMLLGIGLLIGAGVYLIPDLGNLYLDTAVRSGLSAGLFLGFIYFFRISPEINELIRNIVIQRKLY